MRTKQVDIGQYVNIGMIAGSVYSSDKLEVRLPLTDRQLGLLKIDPNQEIIDLNAELQGNFSGQKKQWHGVIKPV